jgi:O-antigen/teichoic acid export membrane protein
VSASSAPTTDLDDTAALAKGGRTSFFGFVLRLVGRVPFLFFSGRLYGPEELGRFAYAVLVVEFAAQLTTLGLKRGLAYELSSVPHEKQTNAVWDAMLATIVASIAAALVLAAFPQAMFPNSQLKGAEFLLPVIVLAVAGSDVALAALAYRHNVQASVLARSIVEQWTLSLAGILLYFTVFQRDGLIIAYVMAMLSAVAFSIWPLVRMYGLPRQWRPDPRALLRMAKRNVPLAGADAVEWTSRRIDIALLGLFFAPAWVGIYFVAQQVSTLAQRLKTSFDPILGPVISQKLQEGDRKAVARQVRQVGFWIIAAQGAVALALAIPGEAVMALSGDIFVAGTAALIFLLAAEVAASTAVVSEAALIYVARHRNLVISLTTLAVQAGLTVGLILLFRAVSLPAGLAGTLGVAPGRLPEAWAMTAPAIALLVALGLASLVKSALLKRLLGSPVVGWRWPLVWAAVAAALAGKIVTWLPEQAKFVELPLGVPLILVVFGTILWRWGFTEDDRVLFRRTPKVKDPMAVSMPLD